MKFDYDRINNNIQALYANKKMDIRHIPIATDSPLIQVERYAQNFGVSIAEILFGEIKPKCKTVEVTIDGDKKTFFIPIDKFENFLINLEDFSV